MFYTSTVRYSLRAGFPCISRIYNKRSFHLIKAINSSFDKDLPTPTKLLTVEKLHAQDTDILLEEIKKANAIDRILELISMHVDVMNNRHLATAFIQIYNKFSDKDYKGQAQAHDLIKNESFQALCNRAMSRARYLEPNEIISIFKTLSLLQVPSNTYVMQAMMKMMCSHLNDFNLSQLIFVNYLMNHQTLTPLVSSLKLAIPLVLQVQIDQQLDSENLNEVVGSLRLACKARLRPTTLQRIIKVLLSKIELFSPDHAATVVYSLLTLDTPVDGYLQLTQSALDIICNNIEVLSKTSLINMTRACYKRKYFYKTFFNAVSKRAVIDRWELSECYELMLSLSRVDYFSPELLELLSEKICSNPNLIRDDSRYSILSLSEFFIFGDHPICNIHNVINVLQSADSKVEFFKHEHPHLYFKLITSWTMLGCVQKEKLYEILTESFLNSVWSLCKKQGRGSEFEDLVCALWWSLENLDYRNEFYFPPKFIKVILASIVDKHKKIKEFPFVKYLEVGLGGSQFFLSGVFTHNGHFIDHVVAMRNGNYPVAIKSAQKEGPDHVYIEELQLPDDAKIIPIIVGTKEHFCKDPNILRGHAAVKLKNLSKLSYSPVIVNHKIWEELSDRERIPYLMREIREVVQTETSKLNIPL